MENGPAWLINPWHRRLFFCSSHIFLRQIQNSTYTYHSYSSYVSEGIQELNSSVSHHVAPSSVSLPYHVEIAVADGPSDLVMCRKQPGIAIGRLCDKCDGKCPVCDSYVRPTTLVRICDECSFGNYQNKCVVCGGEVGFGSERITRYSS